LGTSQHVEEMTAYDPAQCARVTMQDSALLTICVERRPQTTISHIVAADAAATACCAAAQGSTFDPSHHQDQGLGGQATGTPVPPYETQFPIVLVESVLRKVVYIYYKQGSLALLIIDVA
jgi:hypothetical protein